MSEMVERVARALNRSKRNSPAGYPEGWLERHVNENWHLFEDDARIAIAAMREPTETMLAAGDKELDCDNDLACMASHDRRGAKMSILSNHWMHRKCIEPVKRTHGNGPQWVSHRFEIKGGISFRDAMIRDMAQPNILLALLDDTGTGKTTATFRSIPVRIVEAT